MPRTIRPFGELSEGARRNLLDTFREEKAGGLFLLGGAVLALIMANTPLAGVYAAWRQIAIGPEALHLHLTLAQWATDGLLAIFFFVVGLELKREIVVGQLRNPATAVVPVVAAVGGMVVPAAIYLAVNTQAGGIPGGWATPVATDIAFAVGVLALAAKSLPASLRAFLLTLAVADDLLGIGVIAVFYSQDLQLLNLAWVALCVASFALLLRRGITRWWLLWPLGLATWYFMHACGIHATIAGVLLGFVVPARPDTTGTSMAERFEHLIRPLSAGFVVPVFAFFAAGVSLAPSQLGVAAASPVFQGIAAGLVLGKPLGIVLFTWALVTFSRASLDRRTSWLDVLAVAFLAGIGFTVSLLIAELSFGDSGQTIDHARAGVLLGSLAAAIIGTVLLRMRSRHYRHLAATGPETA